MERFISKSALDIDDQSLDSVGYSEDEGEAVNFNKTDEPSLYDSDE